MLFLLLIFSSNSKIWKTFYYSQSIPWKTLWFSTTVNISNYGACAKSASSCFCVKKVGSKHRAVALFFFAWASNSKTKTLSYITHTFNPSTFTQTHSTLSLVFNFFCQRRNHRSLCVISVRELIRRKNHATRNFCGALWHPTVPVWMFWNARERAGGRSVKVGAAWNICFYGIELRWWMYHVRRFSFVNVCAMLICFSLCTCASECVWMQKVVRVCQSIVRQAHKAAASGKKRRRKYRRRELLFSLDLPACTQMRHIS